jgi:hypothetical protein
MIVPAHPLNVARGGSTWTPPLLESRIRRTATLALDDSGRPSARRAPTSVSPTSERRFTEEELALILERAAEQQEGVKGTAARYTLADIQEIAAGAGITPDQVASVAATLRDARVPRRGGVLGAPLGFRFEESIEGEIPDDVVAELFDIARRETGVLGNVSEALGQLEWKDQSADGWTHVSVTRRGGRTTVRVLSPRSDAAGAVGAMGVIGAVGASVGLAMTPVIGGLATFNEPLAGLAAIAGGTASAWLVVRAVWRRLAGKAERQTETLGTTLVEAARRAVDEGRAQ